MTSPTFMNYVWPFPGTIVPQNPPWWTTYTYEWPPKEEKPMNTANLSLRTMTLEPCKQGKHNFQRVVDADIHNLFERADRLILYCPRCGSLLIHSLEDEDDDAGDE